MHRLNKHACKFYQLYCGVNLPKICHGAFAFGCRGPPIWPMNKHEFVGKAI